MRDLPKDLHWLLFDLDGTLTDSAPGILRCVQYALEQCGTPEPDTDKLRPFIGPPLHLIFPRYGAQSDERRMRWRSIGSAFPRSECSRTASIPEYRSCWNG